MWIYLLRRRNERTHKAACTRNSRFASTTGSGRTQARGAFLISAELEMRPKNEINRLVMGGSQGAISSVPAGGREDASGWLSCRFDAGPPSPSHCCG